MSDDECQMQAVRRPEYPCQTDIYQTQFSKQNKSWYTYNEIPSRSTSLYKEFPPFPFSPSCLDLCSPRVPLTSLTAIYTPAYAATSARN